MSHIAEPDFQTENILIAGQVAVAGSYRNVETGLCLQLDREGPLPPSFDGRVACYVPIPESWERRIRAGQQPASRQIDHTGRRP